jgi:hypothetical protein
MRETKGVYIGGVWEGSEISLSFLTYLYVINKLEYNGDHTPQDEKI